jgi:hypothetical protein
MKKIILKANDYKSFIRIPNIKQIIILGHILNTIRSSQRLLIETKDDVETSISLRNKIYALLSCSCHTFEGMKRSSNILKKISPKVTKNTNLYRDIYWIINEVEKNKSSVFKTTLTKIRNKIGFHFNFTISEDYLKKSIVNFPPVIAEGATIKIIDMSYVISDYYIAQFFDNIDPKRDIKSLISTIAEYNLRLCDVLEKIIDDLLSDYTKILE